MNGSENFDFLRELRPTDAEIQPDSRANYVADRVFISTARSALIRSRVLIAGAAALLAAIAGGIVVRGQSQNEGVAQMTHASASSTTTIDNSPLSGFSLYATSGGKWAEDTFINTISKLMQDRKCRSIADMQELLNQEISKLNLTDWTTKKSYVGSDPSCVQAVPNLQTKTIEIKPQLACTKTRTVNCHR